MQASVPFRPSGSAPAGVPQGSLWVSTRGAVRCGAVRCGARLGSQGDGRLGLYIALGGGAGVALRCGVERRLPRGRDRVQYDPQIAVDSPEGLPTAAHPLTTGVPMMPLRVLILGPTALPAATWLHLTSSHHNGIHAPPSVRFDSCRAAAGDTLRIMLPAFAQVCAFADECMYAPSLASRAPMPAVVPVRAARRG